MDALYAADLDSQLWRVLKQCHELHIRWASSVSYPSTIPFVSRVSAGLHVFFTPYKTQSAYVRLLSFVLSKGLLMRFRNQNLCPILRKVFGDQIKCQSAEVLSSSPNSIRHAENRLPGDVQSHISHIGTLCIFICVAVPLYSPVLSRIRYVHRAENLSFKESKLS